MLSNEVLVIHLHTQGNIFRYVSKDLAGLRTLLNRPGLEDDFQYLRVEATERTDDGQENES